jgi:sigma-54-dependent transcriptional regulator
LCSQEFEGNVRELAATIENAVISMEKQKDKGKLLPDESRTRHTGKNDMTLKECVRAFEQSIIRSALLCNNGNNTKAARDLGIPRTSLLRKLQKAQKTGKRI